MGERLVAPGPQQTLTHRATRTASPEHNTAQREATTSTPPALEKARISYRDPTTVSTETTSRPTAESVSMSYATSEGTDTRTEPALDSASSECGGETAATATQPALDVTFATSVSRPDTSTGPASECAVSEPLWSVTEIE